MALLDILKGTQKSRQPAANTAAAQPTAAELQALASTKQTGKAGIGGSAPTTSNIGGQVAASTVAAGNEAQNFAAEQQTANLVTAANQQQQSLDAAQAAQTLGKQNAITDIQTNNSMANAARGAKEEMATKEVNQKVDLATQEMTSKYANAVADLASQRDIAENDIFQNYQESIAELGLDKAAANLEQTAHVLAMSDQKYVDELKRVGTELRLQDELAFKREASSLAMQKNLEILEESFDMERLINADRREFQRAMANIDINTALQLADQAAKEASATNIIQGVTGVAQGAAKAGAFDNLFAGDDTGSDVSKSGSSVTDTLGANANEFDKATYGQGFQPKLGE